MTVLSRHRLRHPYRLLLTAAWVAPPLLLVIAASLANRALPLDARALPLFLGLLPAVYIWREGVDARVDGITRRIHLPATIPYTAMRHWTLRRDLLIVWDERGETLLECRVAHLTDLPRLIAALRAHVGHFS